MIDNRVRSGILDQYRQRQEIPYIQLGNSLNGNVLGMIEIGNDDRRIVLTERRREVYLFSAGGRK